MKTVENNGNISHDCEIEEEMEFSSLYRWQHWLRVISIVALTITGFYITAPFMIPVSDPEPTNFMHAYYRSWHIIFGFVLISLIIFKSYLFLFVKKNQNERLAIQDLFRFKIWKQQIGYYLLICKHPKLSGVYNPVQFVAYIGFYLMMFVLIITGLVLYIHVYHQGLGALLYEPMRYFEVMMGGLANVREIHHIAMWGVIIFIAAHIYMAIFNAVFGKEGAMDAIFSGIKWHKKH